MSQWIITNRNRVKKAFSLLMFPTDVWNTNIKVINVTKLMQMVFNTGFGHWVCRLSLQWRNILPVLCCVWLSSASWTEAHQAPLSMGFPKQEHWSGLPCPSPGELPNPGTELHLLCPCVGRRVFTTASPGQPQDKADCSQCVSWFDHCQFNWPTPPEADPETHLQPEIPSAPSSSSAGHSTFSIHCINLILRFSCIFTFLEIIKHNMPKM